MSDGRLLRLKQVRDLVPVSRSTIYDWMARNAFPAALDLGGGLVAWRESEVRQWIADRPLKSKGDQSGGSGGGSV